MTKKPNDGAILIGVVGENGAGKTTLAEKLAQTLGAKLLEEEVSGNELLEEFYRDRVHYALPVQGKFLLSRFGQLRIDNWPGEGTVITDYVFDKDRLFAQLNLKGEELEIYQGLWQSVAHRVHKPDVIIYLKAELELLAERINQRDRPFERGITTDYLRQLDQGYEEMFSNYKQCPVICVDSESEPAHNQQSWRKLMQQLDSAVPQLAEKLGS